MDYLSMIKLLRSKHNPIRLAFIFGFASFTTWVPLFNLWLEEEGLDGRYIGFIAAIPWIVMLVLQPIWGYLADRYGKLKMLRVSLLASIVLFALFPLLNFGAISILICTTMFSIFYAPILPIIDSIALDYAEDNPGLSYSKLRFWGAPGSGLGAIFTGLFISSFGVDFAFYATSFFFILLLLSVNKIKVRPNSPGIDIKFKDINNLLSNTTLLFFLLMILIVSIGQSTISYFFPLYMREIGASPQITGAALGIQALSELPFYFLAIWLLKRTVPHRIVLFAILATSLRLFLYSITGNPNIVLFIDLMNGITWTLLWLASVEYVDELVVAKWRTTGQSLLWAAYSGAGSVLGNIITARLYQNMSMQKVYYFNSIAILFLFATAGIFFYLRRRWELKMNIRNLE